MCSTTGTWLQFRDVTDNLTPNKRSKHGDGDVQRFGLVPGALAARKEFRSTCRTLETDGFHNPISTIVLLMRLFTSPAADTTMGLLSTVISRWSAFYRFAGVYTHRLRAGYGT